MEKIQNKPVKDIHWNKIEDKTNRSAIESEDSTLDRGKEYIARLKEAMEQILSRPREGTHVSDLTLCAREKVFRKIDPLPISEKQAEHLFGRKGYPRSGPMAVS